MIDPVWTDKLASLVERDHFIREALVKRGDLSDAYHPEIEKVHLENSIKLEKIIEKNGFPVLSNAGEEGVRLAWLIIHHSLSRSDFMRECLTQIRLAVAASDWPLELHAYLEDRVAFYEGRKQLFGTNLDWVDGELKPTEIEDPDQLEHRRKSVGLPEMRKDFQNGERPPVDPEKKQKEFQIWLKKTGWRP
jgi:hypothetical protein